MYTHIRIQNAVHPAIVPSMNVNGKVAAEPYYDGISSELCSALRELTTLASFCVTGSMLWRELSGERLADVSPMPESVPQSERMAREDARKCSLNRHVVDYDMHILVGLRGCRYNNPESNKLGHVAALVDSRHLAPNSC